MEIKDREIFEELAVFDNNIDKKEEAKIFEAIANIEGITEYFKATLSADIKRHFTCAKEQQNIVEGAYSRTMYFYKLIMKALAQKVDKK